MRKRIAAAAETAAGWARDLAGNAVSWAVVLFLVGLYDGAPVTMTTRQFVFLGGFAGLAAAALWLLRWLLVGRRSVRGHRPSETE